MKNATVAFFLLAMAGTMTAGMLTPAVCDPANMIDFCYYGSSGSVETVVNSSSTSTYGLNNYVETTQRNWGRANHYSSGYSEWSNPYGYGVGFSSYSLDNIFSNFRIRQSDSGDWGWYNTQYETGEGTTREEDHSLYLVSDRVVATLYETGHGSESTWAYYTAEAQGCNIFGCFTGNSWSNQSSGKGWSYSFSQSYSDPLFVSYPPLPGIFPSPSPGPGGPDGRVPEPATLVMIGSGLLGLGLAHQRRQRQA